MPDAIITSTASTFGTISGTFAADQSTIVGTVAGSVVGNLSGSVGVPGPAGPAGTGVPAGGTAGQYLQKIDGVDYNTDWVTLNLSAYAPLNSPAFTGNPTAPTAALGDNDTSLATTAFVQQELLSGTANAKNLEVYVRNQTGSTLAAGTIVYINGATGNRPTVTPAQANNDANSAQTFGFVKTAIANNGFGYVIVRGELENIDTSALTEGVQLYLSPTTPGAWTTSKPSAPQHLVYVGIVVRSHPTQGVILVAVQNGYELPELHDVSITSVANNDLLTYESSTALWKNKSFGTLDLATQSWVTGQGYITSASLAPYLTSATAASTYQTIAGMSSYLTTSAAASTYYPLTNPSGYITSSALTGYATESWVTSQGYLVDAPSDGSQYLRQNGAWTTVNFPPDFITSVTSPLSVTSGDLSIDLSAYETTANAAATYQTISGMSSYLTTSAAASTYFTIASAASKANLASPTFTGVPAAPTATAGTSTTQLATTAFVTTADNLKANLASPTFTGTPAAPTAAADTNTTQLATTAYVVGQAGSATPLVNGTAAVGTSLRYARQDHVHGTDTTRAPLASPALTGTPTAPTATAGTSTTQIATTAFVTTADNLKANLASPALTGTPTAPTATAGTNTTQIATTAFVTAAVPAAATHIQSLQFSSTSAYTRVIDASSQLIAPSALKIWPSPSNLNGTSTSGAGAAANQSITGYTLISPSAGVAGNARCFFGQLSQNLGDALWGATSGSQINFSRRVSMAFRFNQFPSSTSSVTRVLLGKIHGTAVGDLTSRGIGVKYVPNGANFDFQLQVHNGTTLTSVTSSTQYAGGVADLEVVSDGAGNAVLYLNGAQVASTTGAPTGTTSANATVFAEIESQATTANQPSASIGRLTVNTLNF